MRKKVIEKIISRITKQKITKIIPLIGKGDVNKVFVIELKNREILLRANSKEEGLMEFKKEMWCIRKAKEKGVLGPNILGIGKYKNFSYMIYDFIKGGSGKDIKDKNNIWRILGEYAKKINSIKVKGYGLRFSPKNNKFLESWEEYIDYNIKSLNEIDKLIELGVYNKKQLSVIKGYFLSLKKKKFNFGLVHNDISLRNAIVDKTGKVFLIDWGCAEANVIPHSEFIEILGAGNMDLKTPTNKEINYFLKGYGISKKQFELLKKELSKFLLLVSFDKLRWAIEKNPDSLNRLSQIAKKRLKYALKING